MRNRIKTMASAAGAVAACISLAVLLVITTTATAQTPAYKAPRTPDGKANLNGIWQAMNTANWNIVGHAAAMEPLYQMGAQGATPPGLGVIEGDAIPYLPAAAAKQK